MKMIWMVLPPAQADDVVQLLLEKGQRVTRLASSGGDLFREGSLSLIVGAADQAVPGILEAVQQRAPNTLALVLPLERYERY